LKILSSAAPLSLATPADVRDDLVAELARFVLVTDPQMVPTIGPLGGDVADLYATDGPDWSLAAPGTRIAPNYDEAHVAQWRIQRRATCESTPLSLSRLIANAPEARGWALEVHERVLGALNDDADEVGRLEVAQLRWELAEAADSARPLEEGRSGPRGGHPPQAMLVELAYLGRHAQLADHVLGCDRCSMALREAWTWDQRLGRNAWDCLEAAVLVVQSGEANDAVVSSHLPYRLKALRGAHAVIAASLAADVGELPLELRGELAALARELARLFIDAEPAIAAALLSFAFELAWQATCPSPEGRLAERIAPFVERWARRLETCGTSTSLSVARDLYRSTSDWMRAQRCSREIVFRKADNTSAGERALATLDALLDTQAARVSRRTHDMSSDSRRASPASRG
jgi:hypothetical protein